MSLLETLRSYKIVDTAIFDYIGTIIVAIILCYYTHIPVTILTIILLILSIPFHYLFHVSTSSTKYLDSLFSKIK